MNKSPSPLEPSRKPASRELSKLLQLQSLAVRCGTEGPRVAKEIDRLRASIPPDLLRCFDHVVEHGRAAVAMVTDSGSCGSCHLKLPSGFADRLHLPSEQVPHCPHCGCFLYS